MDDMLDPEIAALLNSTDSSSDLPDDYGMSGDVDIADGESLYSDGDNKEEVEHVKTIHEVDLSQKEFAPIENTINDTPSDIFQDSSYYKKVLTDENQSSKRVHQLFSKYLTCTDVRDKAVYRQQIVTSYWELLRGMVIKMADDDVPMPKKMLVRFGILLPSLLRPEVKDYFSKVIIENRPVEPILYVDEWFKEIASGRMGNSATDEKKITKSVSSAGGGGEQASKDEKARLRQLQSKSSGRMQSSENLLSLKENERSMLEIELKGKIEDICVHNSVAGFEPYKAGYNELQKKHFSTITDLLHRLSKIDKELSKAFEEYKESKTTYNDIQDKLEMGVAGGAVTNDSEAVKVEFETVHQMSKMTIGRRGNQFPIFTKEFYHCTEKGTGTRENVINVLRWIESIDPGVFHRSHKNVLNRIVPYILLVPTYGDRGFCWEPFDRYNRVTSRGRIVVPMYPKDLNVAVLTAVADLRWQVAKEKASYYWMEEGLTGQYYQYCSQMKLKGDVKEFFVDDYILWITKESNGVQRLSRDVRGIFWRNMPFPDTLKEDLRKRSLVYDELCKKDANREMSDGY